MKPGIWLTAALWVFTSGCGLQFSSSSLSVNNSHVSVWQEAGRTYCELNGFRVELTFNAGSVSVCNQTMDFDGIQVAVQEQGVFVNGQLATTDRQRVICLERDGAWQLRPR